MIPWTAACQASLSFTMSQSLLRFMAIELVMPSNYLIVCLPRFSSCPQSFPASGSFPTSQLFPSGDQSIGASASVSVFPMNIQGSPRDSHEPHNMKASILWHSAFFIIQLSHPYMTTRKTIAFTIQTFFG